MLMTDTTERTWSPQQLDIFHWFETSNVMSGAVINDDGTPIYVAVNNLVVRARAGCLAGDTILNINRAKKGSPMTIEKVVGQFNGEPPLVYRPDLDCFQRMRPWDLSTPTMAARGEDDRVRLGQVKDAWCSGVKHTFTLTTESGRSVRATEEHPFLLESGEWLELGAITPGMRVQVNAGQGGNDIYKKIQYRYTDTKYHPRQIHNGKGRWKVATHRLVVEAGMNKLSFQEFVSILRIDAYRASNLHYLPEHLQVHHRDENPFNNDPNNLEVVSGAEHSDHHDWGANVLSRIASEAVASVESFGEELTYDIEMVDDPHCFLANGFVVHNTGKTTTIIEGINRAPESNILLAAFNKRIAEELAGRITNGNAEAKTLHAIGFACVRRAWPDIRVASPAYNRENDLTDRVCEASTPLEIKKLISKLHTKGREINPHARQVGDLTEIQIQFECEPDDVWAERYAATYIEERALAAMELAAAEKPVKTGIDYADMIFLPVRNHWTLRQYDLVVVDEAQDMTTAQLELAQGVCKKAGRFCVVGDDRQAIYGFRGADSNSLDRLKTELQAAELGLTVTYRCGRTIVLEAQRLVPDFTAGPNNPEGEILTVVADKLLEQIGYGDFLLSRLNAPLVTYAMAMLRQGKRARIAGKDIGQGLKNLVRKLSTGRARNSVTEFLSKLEHWRERECDRYLAAKRYDRVDFVNDQAGMLTELAADAKSTFDIGTKIDALFTDDGLGQSGVVTCSSVHKAKGLEASRVFVLQYTLYPRKKQDREEMNICYVAITRAKNTLVWVTK